VRGLKGHDVVAVLYVDGTTLDSTITLGRTSATLVANLLSPLAPGIHSGIAFASDGRTACAHAWTFRAVR
jgi:hypothetical protein